MSILVHSSAIPVDSCPIPADSCRNQWGMVKYWEKASKHAEPADHNANNADEELVQQQILKISYTITTFSLEELKSPQCIIRQSLTLLNYPAP